MSMTRHLTPTITARLTVARLSTARLSTARLTVAGLTVAGLTVAGLTVAALAGCGQHAAGNGVPTLSASGSAGPHSTLTLQQRRDALHAAAECIRQHGIPTYQDPVLTQDGHVYTDARSVQDAGDDTINAVTTACATQLAAAQFHPDDESPAPPAMVEAGVKVAQCLRANGLPNVKDPTSATPFTPGHGFGMTPDEMPAGGKSDPSAQRALTACHAQIQTEIQLSTLGALGHA
jgi:hypothetical protein